VARHSNVRCDARVRPDGRFFVERRPSGPPWTSPPIHRICSPDRRWVDMWRRTTGGLLEVRRRVRVGQALLYQQFGDLFAIARRFRFRASRRAAACGLADRRDGYLSTRAL